MRYPVPLGSVTQYFMSTVGKMTTMKRNEAPEPHPPQFANEQEAADYWDEHSPLDFPDDFEEVER